MMMTTKNAQDLAKTDAVSRRGFIGRVGSCSLGAAFLASCESAEIFSEGGGLGEDVKFNTTSHPDLATTGGMAKLNASGKTLVLVRKDDATVLAYDAICPHLQCEMTPSAAGGVGAWDKAKNELVCQCHMSRFRTDGTFVEGSTNGGWANPQPAATYTVEFDQTAGTGVVKAAG